MAAIILLQVKKWRWGKLSQISWGKLRARACVCVCVLQHHSRIHHTSPETMHLYVYTKRICLSFFQYFRTRKSFCTTLCFLTLQRTRLNGYYCFIEFEYHFLCDIMWCDNLPRNRSRLSQVTFPYKLFINNYSVTFCSWAFTRNFGILQPSQILNAKNTKILKQNVWQLAPVYPTINSN